MKKKGRNQFVVFGLSILLVSVMMLWNPSMTIAAKKDKAGTDQLISKPNASFDVNKMSDMSDYDPATWVSPTGDTIKIAVIASFSGPAALNGQLYWTTASWVAHDID